MGVDGGGVSHYAGERGLLSPIRKVSSPRFRPCVHERKHLNEYNDVLNAAFITCLASEGEDDALQKHTAKGLKTASSPSPCCATLGRSLYISDLHSRLGSEGIGGPGGGLLDPFGSKSVLVLAYPPLCSKTNIKEGGVWSPSAFILLPCAQRKPFQGLALWLSWNARGIQPTSAKEGNSGHITMCPMLCRSEGKPIWRWTIHS